MLKAERDFATEVAALEARLAGERQIAVARLRAVHEAWARASIGIEAAGDLVSQARTAIEQGVESARAAVATEQLHAAEDRQWEIGTWSTGSGEGLASMAEVRTLQIARAWLLTAGGSDSPVDEARQLLEEAAADPNRSAARHGRHMQALRERLDGLRRT